MGLSVRLLDAFLGMMLHRFIAETSNCDNLEVFIIAETVTQSVDMHVYRTGFGLAVEAPYVVHKLLTREDPSRIGCKLI